MNPKYFKHLAIFCSCTALFVSDQVGNQNVCFLVTRLIFIVSSVPVSTSNLPLPGLDPEKLLVLASGIETHRLESGGACRERRGIMRGGTGKIDNYKSFKFLFKFALWHDFLVHFSFCLMTIKRNAIKFYVHADKCLNIVTTI